MATNNNNSSAATIATTNNISSNRSSSSSSSTTNEEVLNRRRRRTRPQEEEEGKINNEDYYYYYVDDSDNTTDKHLQQQQRQGPHNRHTMISYIMFILICFFILFSVFIAFRMLNNNNNNSNNNNNNIRSHGIGAKTMMDDATAEAVEAVTVSCKTEAQRQSTSTSTASSSSSAVTEIIIDKKSTSTRENDHDQKACRCCPPVFGASTMQGRRPYQEDRYVIVPDLLQLDHDHDHDHKRPQHPPRRIISLVGVYDGHAGGRAAEFCKQSIHQKVQRFLREHNNTSIDDESQLFRQALTEAYLATDREFTQLAKHNNWRDGSTAVVALVVSPPSSRIVVANAGDSRAVLCRRRGSGGRAGRCRVVVPMSHDHKPNAPAERRRIESIAGGFISLYGVWRVQGYLATSRSIGDLIVKPYVIPDPDFEEVQLSEEEEEEEDKDQFLILASDGIWDVFGNQEAVDFVSRILLHQNDEVGSDNKYHHYSSEDATTTTTTTATATEDGIASISTASNNNNNNNNGDSDLHHHHHHIDNTRALRRQQVAAQRAATALVEAAYKRGSLDNLTAVVVDLRGLAACARAQT